MLHGLILDFRQLVTSLFTLLYEDGFVSFELLMRLIKLGFPSLQVLCGSLHLVGCLGKHLIFLEILLHQLVDSAVKLLSLTFKVLDLFLEGIVPGLFKRVESLFKVNILAFEPFNLHLLHANLMLYLRAEALLVLLVLSNSIVESFDLGVFVSEFFSETCLLFFLIGCQSSCRSLLFLTNSEFNFLFFFLVECCELSHLLFVALLNLHDLGLVLVLLLRKLSLKFDFTIGHDCVDLLLRLELV